MLRLELLVARTALKISWDREDVVYTGSGGTDFLDTEQRANTE